MQIASMSVQHAKQCHFRTKTYFTKEGTMLTVLFCTAGWFLRISAEAIHRPNMCKSLSVCDLL